MFIYSTVTEWDFRKAFASLRPDNFSTDGLIALYNYLTDFCKDTGEMLELDVIALCSDFSEVEGTDLFCSSQVVQYLDNGNVLIRDY